MSTVILRSDNVSFNYAIKEERKLANGYGVAVTVEATMSIVGKFRTWEVKQIFEIYYQTIPAKYLRGWRETLVEIPALNTLCIAELIGQRPYQVWQAKTASIPSSLNQALYFAFEALMNYYERDRAAL